jgi:ketosteroid isomerase-like protein
MKDDVVRRLKKGAPVRKTIVILCVMFLFAGLVSALGCSGDTQEQETAKGPEEVIEEYFNAVEQGDVATLISLLDPEGMKQAAEESGLGLEEFEAQIREYMTETFPDGIKIEGLKYEVAVEGDTATVTVTSGTMIIESGGETITEDLTTTSESLELIKKDGKWYLKLEQ